MPHRRLIDRAVTTASTLDSRGRTRAIPEDLLRDASQRLAVMALLGATLWILGPVLGHLAAYYTGARADALRFELPDGIAAASVAISLALFFHARRCPHGPHRSLDLGLFYMIATALAIGWSTHWYMRQPGPITPMISWIGVVVLMFAALIPSAPSKTLIASLVAVSMNPLAMLAGHARLIDALAMHYPDFLLAGVAVVVSHVVTKLGRHVAKAREMGSYQLGELLGRGGMAEVYRATHRMLARPAAIKLIRPEILAGQRGESTAVAVQRFRREAEAAANLRSPHTVELYDFGVTDDQTMYYVMELLDGMDLQSLVRKHGALPARRAIHVLRQVCESLAEAHARGLVHRDIKPANIHIGRLGLQHDFVKVLDFGLVKSIAGSEESLATAAGSTPGTPAYMAPEMVLGESVDGRADIYSLGCVAYYLVTGAMVFESTNPYQAIAKALRDDPVPPSQRTDNPIPPALERLVLSCLEKKPQDRPRDAAELGRALAAVVAEPWGEDDARAWWEANGSAGAPEAEVIDISEMSTTVQSSVNTAS